ncbi:phosphatase PAP2 family protein [Devosia rhizoryzae]|uniref:Phosphatase PAP2 family protein n=1 Tax=Devosia rhizoryzae TaxID=2774137 RepID=A0ABX7C999_9HYPH|nr:phosphatase PAP2 family protein [Devosia rhizoryzae]QQR40848.1 phosphatase PAP2 family protein [Devosia rhizoryzae]
MLKLQDRWPMGLTRNNWPDIAAMVILVLFILVFFDVWASQTLQAWPDVWRQPFAFITDFGLSDWILIPSLLVTLIAGITFRFIRSGFYRRAVWELTLVSGFIFIGVGAPGLLTNLLKRLFGRGRPAEFLESGGFAFQHFVNDWTFQSFPSGHSATAMASALVIGFMAPRFFKLILLIAAMTGVSRIVIGMHYPTDVVAGFIIGLLGAYAVRNLFAARRLLFAALPDGTVRFRGTPNLRRIRRKLFQRATE